MPFGRSGSPTREVYADLNLPRVRRKRNWKPPLLIAAACIVALGVYLGLYLRSLSGGTAMAEARDMVTLRVSETVNRIMSERDYGYDYFVALEKDTEGNITAVTTNTARVNLLASEVMNELAMEAENGQFNVRVPLGDLLGAGVLLGRGPAIDVQIGMMTSSIVRFENDLVSTGINQSRHTLTLVADIDIDMLIPWGSMKTTVTTDILVAETVIVGRVPGTYVTVER